jgi:hypothetical protein
MSARYKFNIVAAVSLMVLGAVLVRELAAEYKAAHPDAVKCVSYLDGKCIKLVPAK